MTPLDPSALRIVFNGSNQRAEKKIVVGCHSLQQLDTCLFDQRKHFRIIYLPVEREFDEISIRAMVKILVVALHFRPTTVIPCLTRNPLWDAAVLQTETRNFTNNHRGLRGKPAKACPELDSGTDALWLPSDL